MNASSKLARRLTLLAMLLLLVAVGCNKGQKTKVTTGDTAAVKITVDQPGIYRITQADLQAAGMTIDAIESDKLLLSADGEPVPYLIQDEALVFYGTQSTSRYTQQKLYVLELDKAGTLMHETEPATADDTVIATIPQTVRGEENIFYEQRAIDDDHQEAWFWKTIRHRGDDAIISVDINLPAVAAGEAEIRLNLWGASYSAEIENDHDYDLLINDQFIETVSWDGNVHITNSVTIPDGILKDGKNSITLDNSGTGAAALDIMQLNWIEIDYLAPAQAENGRITFTDIDGTAQISGFSKAPVALEISDPAQPRYVETPQFEDGTLSLVTSAENTFIAVDIKKIATPDAIAPLLSSEWKTDDVQADLIIITTDELASALDDLVAAREEEGLSVALVMVDEIYDAFGYGDPSAESLNNFVRYAWDNWQTPKPKYLFLVGDATTDTLGNLDDGSQPANIVPSQLITVDYSGETVSDARIADVDGDLKPDLAVGRWPVDNVSDVRNLVERTLAYENGVSAETALFALDATSSEFANFASRVISESGIEDSNIDILDGPDAATVADTWNAGAWMVSYVGHGSLELWGQDEVFSVESITNLSQNSDVAPPIVMQFSCLTGQFAHPKNESISERLLKHEGGPVLVIASTSLTLSSHQSPLAANLLSEFKNPNNERIGDALLAAKADLKTENNPGLQEISDTFGLIGDPSARLQRPESILADPDLEPVDLEAVDS